MASLMARFKTYSFPALLLFSILAGGMTGYWLGPRAAILKPLGDIFLNLLFAAVVPLVFFSISSSVTHLRTASKLINILAIMFAAFVFTGIIAAIFMLFIVSVFPPAQGIILKLALPSPVTNVTLSEQLVNMISVSDFSQLLTHKNMLPLIVFSLLTGLATAAAQQKGKAFASFLQAGANVFMKMITFIMYYAPIGFFAYFAVMISELGPQLLAGYLRVTFIYYSAALIYAGLAFSLYAWLGGGKQKIRAFWRHASVPMLTAFATCSSAASIPANLQATRDMGVSDDIGETVIPMGAMLHKDGSVLGAMVKIAFLFGIFGMSFSSPVVMLTAVALSILVGTVMGAIPGGGMLGELLILSFYGFPPQALVMIAAISILIDPLATMLNVSGDSVCAMMIDRWVRKQSG